MQSFYKELVGLTIKSEVLRKYEDDCKELLKIDLLDVENHIKNKDMHGCFGTQQELIFMLRKDCATRNDINKS